MWQQVSLFKFNFLIFIAIIIIIFKIYINVSLSFASLGPIKQLHKNVNITVQWMQFPDL